MPGFILQLGKALPKGIEKDSGGESKEELIRHHLDDIKQALIKCYKSLESGDLEEVKDNAVIIQSSGMDVEELITGEEPEV